jgi:hypothetical protein
MAEGGDESEADRMTESSTASSTNDGTIAVRGEGAGTASSRSRRRHA